MWKQKKTSIYYQKIKNKIFFIKKKDLFFLKKNKNLKNGKGRICVHTSPKAKIHEMIVFHKKGAYVRPHKHLNRLESFHIIKGNVTLILFDDYGKPIRKIEMGDYSSGKVFYYKIQKSYFHTQLINKDTIFKEVTTGPFNTKNSLSAKWSPENKNTKKIKEYINNLRKKTNKLH